MLARPSVLLLLVLGSLAPAVWGQTAATDQWLERPVDDRTFATFLDFFVYDDALPFQTAVLDTVRNAGIEREHLRFVSTRGETVFAYYYRPQGATGGARVPTAILLHGGVPQGKEGRGSVITAELLARAGWAVLALDMKHFGERSTDLLTTFTEDEKHERLYNQPSVYLDWVVQTVKDVQRTFDFVVRERRADPDRVALIGFSRGAQLGVFAGAVERRFRMVALLHGGHFDRAENGHLAAACPANYIGRIAPRPLLMLNAELDADYFKASSVEPLQRLARQPRLFRWSETGHGVFTEQDQAALIEWLNAQARGAARHDD